MEIVMNNQDNQKALEQLARERINRTKKFYNHLLVYAIGVAIYVSKTYFGAPLNFLPIKYINEFVMWFWTFCLVVQGVRLFFTEKVFGYNWEQKRVNKIMEKEKSANQKWE